MDVADLGQVRARALFCPDSNNVRAGDQWLASHLPALLSYAAAHDGVVFLVWDEGDATQTIPFLALGPKVVPGDYDDTYTHSSALKTTEELLGLPRLATVQSSNDLSAMFAQ